MEENLRLGEKFPDIETSSHEDEVVKLSSIIRGFPTAVVFSRGHFCPKDRRQLLNYVAQLQPELIVNYCSWSLCPWIVRCSPKKSATASEPHFLFCATRIERLFENWISSTRPTQFAAR